MALEEKIISSFIVFTQLLGPLLRCTLGRVTRGSWKQLTKAMVLSFRKINYRDNMMSTKQRERLGKGVNLKLKILGRYTIPKRVFRRKITYSVLFFLFLYR